MRNRLLGQAIDERAGMFLEEALLLDMKKHRLTRTKAQDLKNLSLKAFKELLQKIVGNDNFWTVGANSMSIVLLLK